MSSLNSWSIQSFVSFIYRWMCICVSHACCDLPVTSDECCDDIQVVLSSGESLYFCQQCQPALAVSSLRSRAVRPGRMSHGRPPPPPLSCPLPLLPYMALGHFTYLSLSLWPLSTVMVMVKVLTSFMFTTRICTLSIISSRFLESHKRPLLCGGLKRTSESYNSPGRTCTTVPAETSLPYPIAYLHVNRKHKLPDLLVNS